MLAIYIYIYIERERERESLLYVSDDRESTNGASFVPSYMAIFKLFLRSILSLSLSSGTHDPVLAGLCSSYTRKVSVASA